MNRNFEDLITGRLTDNEKRNAVFERQLARSYSEAYTAALARLKDLYLTLGDKIDLVEAKKYQRLDKLIKSIAVEYKALTGRAIKSSGDWFAQNYQDAFYSYTWSMEQATVNGTALNTARIGASWGALPTGAIEASVMSEASGLTYVKTWTKNMEGELWRVQSTLTRGIALGQSYAKTAKELQTAFSYGASDAMRLVVTEVGRNFSEGFLAAHDKAVEAGIKVRKRWVATLDGRTRPSHGAADGQYADEKGNFHVGGATGQAPGLMSSLSENIRCRCRAIDELQGFPATLRRVGGDIQPYVTFSDWAGPQGWSEKKGWHRK